MITYEDAKKKALKEDSKVNAVMEYKLAYVFYNSNAKGVDTQDNEVVILKSNGNMISMSELAVSLPDGDEGKKRAF